MLQFLCTSAWLRISLCILLFICEHNAGEQIVGKESTRGNSLYGNSYNNYYNYNWDNQLGNTFSGNKGESVGGDAVKVNRESPDLETEFMESGEEEDEEADDSSDMETMILGEEDTPPAELLNRAKRYLSHMHLGAYTPATPFYQYNYNLNTSPSTYPAHKNIYENPQSPPTSPSSQGLPLSINPRTMESLLASCQLTNLLLYRAVQQKSGNHLNTPGTTDYSKTVQHIPLAIGTFGALIDSKFNADVPQQAPKPVTSQPVQSYITTRTFLTTATTTEIVTQDSTLSVRTRTYALSTSKVHTLYFTRDISPSATKENFQSHINPYQASYAHPPSAVPGNAANITKEKQSSRVVYDLNRPKRGDEDSPEAKEVQVETSEEDFDVDDDYGSYQYGSSNNCPPLGPLSTTTETKTTTVVKTITKYMDPTSTAAYRGRTLNTKVVYTMTNVPTKRKANVSERAYVIRPVGRLLSYRSRNSGVN